MKKLKKFISMLILSLSISTTGFAATEIIDNDTILSGASNKPYYGVWNNSGWTYQKSGYYGDSRIYYNSSSSASYYWLYNKHMRTATIDVYIWDYKFTDPHVEYTHMINNNGLVSSAPSYLDQNNAPGGWNRIFTNTNINGIFELEVRGSGRGNIGADAVRVNYN